MALCWAQGHLPVLLQSSPGPLVRHPCYHSGYWTTLSPAALYESPCVHSTPPPDLARTLTVEGTGNPGACVSAIRGLFNFSSCEGRGHCAFDGVYQPPVRGRFYVSTLHCPPQGPSLLLEPQGPDARWAPDEPWTGGVLGTLGPRVCVGGGLCLVRAGATLIRAHLGIAPVQARPSYFPAPGLLQLLLHLPLPEPHLQAAADHRQRHYLGVLPETLEAGVWILGPPVPTRATPALWAAASRHLGGPHPGPCGQQGWGAADGREDSPLAIPLQAGGPGPHPWVGAASGGPGERASPPPHLPAPRWRRARQGRTAVPRACIYSHCCSRATGSGRRPGPTSSSTNR